MNPCALPPSGNLQPCAPSCAVAASGQLPRFRYLGFRARWWGGVHIYPLKGVYVYSPPSLWTLVYQDEFKYICNQEDGFTAVNLKISKYMWPSSKVNLPEDRKANSGLFCACIGKNSGSGWLRGATDGSGATTRRRAETGPFGVGFATLESLSIKSLFHNPYYGKCCFFENQCVSDREADKRRGFLRFGRDLVVKAGDLGRFRTDSLRFRAVIAPNMREGARYPAASRQFGCTAVVTPNPSPVVACQHVTQSTVRTPRKARFFGRLMRRCVCRLPHDEKTMKRASGHFIGFYGNARFGRETFRRRDP